jgi:hypothetical protein
VTKRLRCLVVFVCIAFPSIAWGQDKSPKPSQHSGLPIVGEFQRNEVESPQDQVHRQMREEKFGKGLLTPLSDPGKLVDGMAETTNLTFINYVMVNDTDIHGIPASKSAAVIIGHVLSGKCYINRDHDYVYTDYEVRIDEILKQDQTTILTVGQQVVASKPGGAIHFASGHETKIFIAGHGFPIIGSQYVFFLFKPIPDFPEYETIFASGYELKDNHVLPLDDTNPEYENKLSSEFLDLTRKAIAATGGRP